MKTDCNENFFFAGSSRAVLSGRVIRDPYVFENGVKSVLLQSNQSASAYSITRVHVPMNANITADKFLYVAGDLMSGPFEIADGKRRYQYTVCVKEMSFISKSFRDINSVELRATVVGDIINTDEFSQFRVITTYIPK